MSLEFDINIRMWFLSSFRTYWVQVKPFSALLSITLNPLTVWEWLLSGHPSPDKSSGPAWSALLWAVQWCSDREKLNSGFHFVFQYLTATAFVKHTRACVCLCVWRTQAACEWAFLSGLYTVHVCVLDCGLCSGKKRITIFPPGSWIFTYLY